MNWDRRLQAIVLLVAVALVFTAGFKYALWQSERQQEEQQELVVSAVDSQEAEEETAGDAKMLAVHVAGAVKNPGVFYLPQGSRVNDVIEKAGPVAEADINQLNLAALVNDGEKVYLPKIGEQLPALTAAGNGGVSAAQGKININTASNAELETLPGIGPVLAKRIIDYRELNGPYCAIEDLDKVSGFGVKRFEEIKDLVTI